MDGTLLGIMVFLIAFYILFGICLFRNAKKTNDENKNKMDGRLLGRGDLSEEEVSVLDSEWPTYDSYQSLN